MAEASSASATPSGGNYAKSGKTSSSVMPYVVGVAVAIALLLLWSKRSKAAGIDTPAPPPLDNGDLKPILYVNPKPVPIDNPPPPADNTPKSYTYRISGTSIDLTPGTLAQSWGQTDTSAALQQLVAANQSSSPPLKNQWSLQVVFVGDTTGAMDSTLQSIVRDQDTAGSITVNPDTTAGFGYGQNPMPGFSGQWRGTGVRSPVISPWSAGQVVKIPAEWGDPPTRDLSQNATVV